MRGLGKVPRRLLNVATTHYSINTYNSIYKISYWIIVIQQKKPVKPITSFYVLVERNTDNESGTTFGILIVTPPPSPPGLLVTALLQGWVIFELLELPLRENWLVFYLLARCNFTSRRLISNSSMRNS